MSALIRPRNGSPSLGARSTKQALQSRATLSSRMLKALVLKTKIDFFPTQSYRLLTTQIISIWTVYTDFFSKSTNRNTGLKKKVSWSLSLSSWACLGALPLTQPCFCSWPWVAPTCPLWQLSASPCRSGETWACWRYGVADLASRSGTAEPAYLGLGPCKRMKEQHWAKQEPSNFKGLIISVVVPFLDSLLMEGRGPQRIHN